MNIYASSGQLVGNCLVAATAAEGVLLKHHAHVHPMLLGCNQCVDHLAITEQVHDHTDALARSVQLVEQGGVAVVWLNKEAQLTLRPRWVAANWSDGADFHRDRDSATVAANQQQDQ